MGEGSVRKIFSTIRLALFTSSLKYINTNILWTRPKCRLRLLFQLVAFHDFPVLNVVESPLSSKYRSLSKVTNCFLNILYKDKVTKYNFPSIFIYLKFIEKPSHFIQITLIYFLIHFYSKNLLI